MTSERVLLELRPRLLAYCQHLTGDLAHAEDLAQECLLVALKQLRAGQSVADWPRWLGGIARTLAKNAQRRTRTRRQEPLDPESLTHDDLTLESLLLAERGRVLERAFAHLDPETRRLLTQRYLEELPVGELAQQRGASANATSLRLLRARAALERVLATELRPDALAHGLIDTETAAGWVESPLYCPRCATRRLQGRLTRTTLALRCPGCDPTERGLQGLSTHAAPMPTTAVLAGAQGFRVAQRRVNQWWEDYLREGIRTGRARCPRCGGEAPVQVQVGETVGFHVVCSACPGVFFVAPQGLLFHEARFQAFWRDHPRLVNHAPQRLRYEGRDAVLVSFSDRQGRARLEAIYATDDLTVLF